MQTKYFMSNGRAAVAAPYRAALYDLRTQTNPPAAPDRRARIKMVVAAGPNRLYAVIPGPGRTTTASDVGSAAVR
jgi:hypothetical protein